MPGCKCTFCAQSPRKKMVRVACWPGLTETWLQYRVQLPALCTSALCVLASLVGHKSTTGYKRKQGLFDLSTVIEAISVRVLPSQPIALSTATSEQWILKNVQNIRVLILQIDFSQGKNDLIVKNVSS